MIKIEVTGNSIAEVADKLLALGASLSASGASTAHPTRAEAAEWAAENAAQAMGVKTDAPATPEEVGKVAETPSTPAEPAATTSTPAAPSDAPIDADALKTLVLSVVKTKGRDTMVAILEQFGVAKATDVPAELLGELVAALKAALA